MKLYFEGDFVKKCLTDVTEEMCPEMVQEFEKISLSRWTIARCIDEFAGDICDQGRTQPPQTGADRISTFFQMWGQSPHTPPSLFSNYRLL